MLNHNIVFSLLGAVCGIIFCLILMDFISCYLFFHPINVGGSFFIVPGRFSDDYCSMMVCLIVAASLATALDLFITYFITHYFAMN